MNSIYQLSSPNNSSNDSNVTKSNILLKQQLNNYLNQPSDTDLQSLLLINGSSNNSLNTNLPCEFNEMLNLNTNNNSRNNNYNDNNNIIDDSTIQQYKKLIMSQQLINNNSNQLLIKNDFNNNSEYSNNLNDLLNNNNLQQQHQKIQQVSKSYSNLQKLFELQQMKNRRLEKLLTVQQQQQTALNNYSNQFNNNIINGSSGYVSNKQANMMQHEFIKKVLETKKQQEQQLIQEQQYQNQVKLQQLQQQHQLLQLQQQQQQQQQLKLQQQQLNSEISEAIISKEYILSKIKAQKEQQKQQQQFKQLQQSLQVQQNIVDNINLSNLMNGSYSSTASSTSDLTSISETPSVTNQPVKINLMHLLNNKNNNNINTNQCLVSPTANDSQNSINKSAQPKNPIEKLKMLLIKNNQLNEQHNNIKTNVINESQSPPSTYTQVKQQQQQTQSSPQPQHIKKNLVEISSEGIIKNIPPNMLVDQYGMLGLAMMYKHKDDAPNELDRNISVIIGKGHQVQSIVQETNKTIASGSNTNEANQSVLHMDNNESSTTTDKNSLHSARSDHLTKIAKLPNEYNISSIKDKLFNLNDLLKSSKDDLLFCLFYMCCMDDLQTRAYNLLVSRNWTFHNEYKLWIKPSNSIESLDESSSSLNKNDNNLYCMFDVNTWQVKKFSLNLPIENNTSNNNN
jgi:hypothetical protein